MLAALAGGLLRAGWLPDQANWPAWMHSAWLRAASMHAALMINGFLGTVIGVERAVALRHPLALAPPACAAAAGIALLCGQRPVGAALLCLAAIGFCVVNVVLWRRQRAPHTALLGVAALIWLVASIRFALGAADMALMAAWFAFLVLTIAAERLEMTRLRPRRAHEHLWLSLALLGLLAGCLSGGAWPRLGGLLYGAGLVWLAGWLARHDIARRTITTQGLPRYMACCLLLGYAWLGVAGLAWAAHTLGAPTRDAALHALGIGFVLSMILAHALVILPAVTGVKVAYTPWFYVPVALLHASLLWRVLAPWLRQGTLAGAAAMNVAALLSFVLCMLAGRLLWLGQTRRERQNRPA